MELRTHRTEEAAHADDLVPNQPRHPAPCTDRYADVPANTKATLT